MLRIFRTNQLLFGIVLLFYGAILHFSIWLYPIELTSARYGILGQWINQLGATHYYWLQGVALLLLFLQGFALNFLVAEHRLSTEVNLFPGLVYLLLTSSIPEFLAISPLHFANVFLLISLWQLMTIYKVPSCADRIFNIGFWIGVASLFYLSYGVFLILGLVGLNIMRAFSLRERLQMILGFIMPYLLCGLYFFWTDRWDDFIQSQFVSSFGFLSFRLTASLSINIAIALFIIFLIIVLMSSNGYLYKTQIQVQKKISLLFWTLLIGSSSLLIQKNIGLEHLLIMALPLSILLSINLTKLSPRIADTVHIVLWAGVLFYQLKDLIF